MFRYIGFKSIKVSRIVKQVYINIIYAFFSSELFTTVLDMLAALIHTTQVSDTSSSDRGEENRKQYLNLVKKLKVRIFSVIFMKTKINKSYLHLI